MNLNHFEVEMRTHLLSTSFLKIPLCVKTTCDSFLIQTKCHKIMFGCTFNDLMSKVRRSSCPFPPPALPPAVLVHILLAIFHPAEIESCVGLTLIGSASLALSNRQPASHCALMKTSQPQREVSLELS